MDNNEDYLKQFNKLTHLQKILGKTLNMDISLSECVTLFHTVNCVGFNNFTCINCFMELSGANAYDGCNCSNIVCGDCTLTCDDCGIFMCLRCVRAHIGARSDYRLGHMNICVACHDDRLTCDNLAIGTFDKYLQLLPPLVDIIIEYLYK